MLKFIDSLNKFYGNKKGSISQGDAAVEFFVPEEFQWVWHPIMLISQS